jgi:hypothetical protein
MRARIYQPPKTAMQSGGARTREWVLEYESARPQRAEPLMGWIGGSDTISQVRLSFDSREAAESYAKAHGIDYQVEEPKPRHLRPKAYADNFRFGRAENWTH